MRSSLSGWILAGGQSRRMGSNKALLQNETNTPFISNAIAILSPLFEPVSIIGDPTLYTQLGYTAFPDLRPNCGPLAGLETILTHTKSDWNAVLACDLPSIPTVIFETLTAQIDHPADAILPRHPDGRLEPLCALYHRRALVHIRAALDAGTRKVTDALAPLTLRYLPVADPRIFHNLNTPADLEQYLESRRA